MSLNTSHVWKWGMALFLSAFVLTSCDNDNPEGPEAGFLASNVDALDEIELGGFTIPTSYDLSGTFAPGAYNGQIRRIAQLKEIVDSSRNEPIFWDLRAALANENRDQFASTDAQGNSDLRTKIDELNYDNGNTSVADDFANLADSLVMSSQANYTVVASNGVAGMITTGDKKRHVSANGLEYAQILEKGMYGPLLYDQMVDDYLRTTQAGAENPSGNNESATSDYASLGTDRQHRWDEAFGYLGADPATYPNASNSSTGDGIFMSNYTFDFSDETEDAFGINLAQKLMDAFILGRAALKAGEGFGPSDETTNEAVFDAARADVKLYMEAGLAAAAYHYLNDAIADITDEDKIHHISEALGFIYALGFNAEGRLTATEAHNVLKELGWSSSDASLNGMYQINLWDITDEQLQAAKDLLDESFPGFGEVPF